MAAKGKVKEKLSWQEVAGLVPRSPPVSSGGRKVVVTELCHFQVHLVPGVGTGIFQVSVGAQLRWIAFGLKVAREMFQNCRPRPAQWP